MVLIVPLGVAWVVVLVVTPGVVLLVVCAALELEAELKKVDSVVKILSERLVVLVSIEGESVVEVESSGVRLLCLLIKTPMTVPITPNKITVTIVAVAVALGCSFTQFTQVFLYIGIK